MRRFGFDRAYLRDFAALDPGLTAQERETLERFMAQIVQNPAAPGRLSSFYDPDRPSWLLRSDPFVVHYTHDDESDEVIFLNLFRRR